MSLRVKPLEQNILDGGAGAILDPWMIVQAHNHEHAAIGHRQVAGYCADIIDSSGLDVKTPGNGVVFEAFFQGSIDR